MVETEKPRVAFLGTGLMGRPMAERLIGQGYSLVAYNRTREKAESLKASGAEVVDTPVQAICQADCVVLMLAHAPAIQEVMLSEEVSAQLSMRTVIQMGTIGPSESRELEQQVKAVGGNYLEAPVLGSIPQAEQGSLIVMVGSSPEMFEQWSPLFRCFGPEPRLIGPVGKAAALKLALNQLIASLTVSFALSLGIVTHEGIPVEQFMEILRGSALYAPTFDKKLSQMVSGDYENPNFPTRHLLKDVDLILDTAQEMGLDGAGLRGIRTVLEKTMTLGWANADYSALFETIRLDN
ncbi:MAG: NAD(P)-dependent oxidoreductase [Acidobacteriota bacterium]